jgi:uncharacterized protein YycO
MVLLNYPGDLFFYKKMTQSSNIVNTIVDNSITSLTQSPYVHVAIAISAAQKIEATFAGVSLSAITAGRPDFIWSYRDHASVVDSRLISALQWLTRQVGQPYGYGDIIEAVLYKLQHGLNIEYADHFDCSALAVEFLLKAGGVAEMIDVTNAHQYTPGSLATLLHIS